MSHSNRRTHQRQSLSAEGWISVSADNWLPINTVDVSKGGFSFISKEEIEIGALRHFRLRLPNNAGLMHVQGRIAHCCDWTEIGVHRIGVQAMSVNVVDMAAMLTRPGLPQPDAKLDLTFTRTIDVPREKVWAAWTQPEYLKQWFTPAPWITVDCEIDLRPGGRFYTMMQSPEGQQFPNVGVYLEVIENEKLVWTNALAPGGRPAKIEGDNAFQFTAVIALETQGAQTRYTATVMHRDEADRSKHEAMGFHEGWGTALDQLIALAKSM
jgi:uncharacterized protein YndB with AHSA1/START domain